MDGLNAKNDATQLQRVLVREEAGVTKGYNRLVDNPSDLGTTK
jgi:hypothetical protein